MPKKANNRKKLQKQRREALAAKASRTEGKRQTALIAHAPADLSGVARAALLSFVAARLLNRQSS